MNYDVQGFNQALCDMFYLNITNRILERDYNNIIPSLRLYRLLKDKLHYASKVTTTDIKVNDHVSGNISTGPLHPLTLLQKTLTTAMVY